MRTTIAYPLLLVVSLAAAACGGDDDGVDSDEEARRAYLGLDTSIEKALNLGMQGYGEATNANIPAQSGVGDVSGTIEVSGQVDAGASSNKEMRLYVDMVDYNDGPVVLEDDEEIEITYDTDPADLPYLELSLRNIPNGTFTGSLLGTYLMAGEIEGSVTLDLSMSGQIEDDGAGGIRRIEGTTTITGVATSGDGTYDVDLTL